MHRSISMAIALVVFAGATACVRNPVTGKRQLSLVSEDQEIALGQEAKQQISQGIGLVEEPALQSYVSEVGMKLAKSSERPQLPWSFQVVDDASVNAFALPGGPIFITRGMLAHLNSEAELAVVLGHEVGHVTAKHSVAILSKQQLAQLGLGVGSIFLPEDLRGLGQLAGAGTQLLFLKYGRDAERQSDELAFEYSVKQGYDPREMKDVFVTLQRVSNQQGAEGRLPEWLSTHPDPENRVAAAEALISQRGARGTGGSGEPEVGRDEYVKKLDGLVFGENPRQGFFKANTFLHPDLRFQVQFPASWKTLNQPQAVIGVSPKQDAIIELGLIANLSPEQAARQFFSQRGVRPGDVSAGQLNSLPSVAGTFLADTEQGTLGGIVAFIQHEGRTLQLIGYTPAQLFRQHDAALRATLSSFAPLTDPAALSVQPARIEVVTTDRAMTVSEAYARFPSSVPVETFALINGLEREGNIPAGTPLKRVVGGVGAPAVSTGADSSGDPMVRR